MNTVDSKEAPEAKEEQEVVEKKALEVLVSTPELGTLVHVPAICTGCGICELMCSLYHEGVQAPALARLQVVNNPFTSKKAGGTFRK
jgi:ferredoxin